MEKATTKVFENLFQLNAEPLYVSIETPVEANIQQDSSTKEVPQKKKKNMFPTIFSSLSAAESQSVIKINTGLYSENNDIKIPGLRLQINEPSSNVVLANEQFPSLVINLPHKDDKVFFENLKFAHICESSKGIIRWPSLRQLRDNRYRALKTGDNINTSIIVRKGVLQIDECRFSMAGQKDPNRLFGCIIVEEQGSLVMTRCEITGGAGSIGIYCNGGRVNIRQSCFKDHGGIGILMMGGKESSLVLKNSIISNCTQGIVLNGPFCSSVENNVITQSSSYGIATLFGNSSNLINNQIRDCRCGIEIENSCPKVMKNNLIANKDYGVSIFSKMNGDCCPLLRFNQISQNKKGGMLVSGSRNRAQICNNVISLNQKLGMRVESNAHPHIFLNEISNNFGNGIYICGGATSFLEKNEISGSLNCNLILEGPNNIDNYVYNNKIHGARGQGIFLIHCQKFLIAKNHITHNYNGILCATSVVNIQDNQVKNNKCNGIMLIDDSHILMSENTLEGNKVAGFVCRNTSKAKMRMNRFLGNKIELVIEKGWEGIEELQSDNQFVEGADIRTPGNIGCEIM